MLEIGKPRFTRLALIAALWGSMLQIAKAADLPTKAPHPTRRLRVRLPPSRCLPAIDDQAGGDGDPGCAQQ
jgi:hypothetical protein